MLFDQPSVLCFKARPKKRPPKAFNARRTINILLPFAYSEDGFYATWIKAPLEGGQWSVEAVSLSPFHGMRMAQPQPLLRTKPIHLRIEGIPTTMRRGEILANFTLMARNNMPISLQVFTILTLWLKDEIILYYNKCACDFNKQFLNSVLYLSLKIAQT